MRGGIKIDGDTRISNLLKKFNNNFPFLKIEISRRGEDYSRDHRDFKLFELATVKKPQEFWIYEDMKVIDVEEIFKNSLGLQIAIYRKMGKSLVETTFTSQWTLSHQNEKGQEIFSAI
jgi:hypothetical protein